jgi:hypothetical protein
MEQPKCQRLLLARRLQSVPGPLGQAGHTERPDRLQDSIAFGLVDAPEVVRVRDCLALFRITAASVEDGNGAIRTGSRTIES